MKNIEDPNIDKEDVRRDIDVMLRSMELSSIRRFFHQRFWEIETQEAEYASRIEPFPRLESVSEHSWHLADTILLIGGHFPHLNLNHCLRLAILHDKMEIFIGDQNPVGRDGAGLSTHAFNSEKQAEKDFKERQAIENYLSLLRTSAHQQQRDTLFEILEGKTEEARFVKAIDKLQALSFILKKKKGVLTLRHLKFTLRYSEKILDYYPMLYLHYKELRSRLMEKVAERKKICIEELERQLGMNQLKLPFDLRKK